MSKQALIDRVWRERLQSCSVPVLPAAPVPALRPEPGRARATPLPWAMIAATALTAFAGVAIGTAMRAAFGAMPVGDDDIDWLSGIA